MIRVTVFRSEGRISGFRLTGHADYDEYGKDIICSAMSMLAINTLNSMIVIANERFDYDQNEEDGLIEVRFDHEPNEYAGVLLSSFELGVQGVIDQYGNEFVSLVYETDE